MSLRALIIPDQGDESLDDRLRTFTARRLIAKGATLYLLKDGKTSVLSLTKPDEAFCKAACLHLEDTPCAA
jgi:hypothetical protein